VRIFFKPIDDAGDAIFDERHLEVDEQPKSLVGEGCGSFRFFNSPGIRGGLTGVSP
jgi:hypothetical protein